MLFRDSGIDMSQENIALIRRWFEEVWNKGRLEAIDEMASADVVAHGHAPYDIGLEQFRSLFNNVRGAFPDIRIGIDFTLAEDDKVAARWTATATHKGSFLGYAATGRAINVSGVSIMRIAGGKIVEAWDTWDQLGLMVQIGAALGHEFFAPPGSTGRAS
jgi:steroid delta-isomerase-like uncharacterized protein